MKIHLAAHLGMCFGVREALRATHDIAIRQPVTILGQLVHNPVVDKLLKSLGVRQGSLSGPSEDATPHVVVTAHGAADADRERWEAAGHQVTDTTCPLVRKAHSALAQLVAEGYQPVVIGQASHVEVKGLVGDFPQAVVVLNEPDLSSIPAVEKIGIISQTTQPLMRVLELVDAIKRLHPAAEVRFVDTVCHPTKQRQSALEDLCAISQLIIVVGGRNSNNTRQLAETARARGVPAIQVEGADDLRPGWFDGLTEVGVTAGTSTLDETVRDVVEAIRRMAQVPAPLHEFLRMAVKA